MNIKLPDVFPNEESMIELKPWSVVKALRAMHYVTEPGSILFLEFGSVKEEVELLRRILKMTGWNVYFDKPDIPMRVSDKTAAS